jgi:WD40 repeat protein
VELTDRLVRLHALSEGGVLATDVRGRLHRLDEGLGLVRSSPVIPDGVATYCLAVDGNTVVTKDRQGTVIRWRLDTLDPTSVLAAAQLRATDGDYLEDEEPSPTINRGIGIWNGRVYVNNGYLQVAVLDLETFSLLQVAEPFSPVYLEWICTDRPGQQAVSDKTGRLFLGDLENLDFPLQVTVDSHSNVHRVLYDPVHDRYWATQDAGDDDSSYIKNGIVTVLPDGSIEQSLKFASDDVECLAFNSDFSRAYSGGFDGELHIFDNTRRELTIIDTVRVFSHEIIDLAVLADGNLAVLTQDGRVVLLSPEGVQLGQNEFRPQCVWDIQPVPGAEDALRVATDTGVSTVRIVEQVGGPNLLWEHEWGSDTGFVRRIQCTADSTFGITHGGEVFRLDREGAVMWRDQYSSRLHTLSISPDGESLLVAANEGAFEHSARTGERIAKFELQGRQPWATCYLPDGHRIVATHDCVVSAFPPGADQPSWRVDLEGYPKRMWTADGRLWLTGGGGVRQLDPRTGDTVRVWGTLLENTVENAVEADGFLYAVSYGCQLGVFDASTCADIGLVEPIPDFPKGMAVLAGTTGPSHVLLGGRGGFIEIRRVTENGEPILVRTVTIPR